MYIGTPYPVLDGNRCFLHNYPRCGMACVAGCKAHSYVHAFISRVSGNCHTHNHPMLLYCVLIKRLKSLAWREGRSCGGSDVTLLCLMRVSNEVWR